MKKSLSVILLSICFISLSGQTKLTDKRDNNVYSTITIEGTTWMAENLKYKVNSGTICFDNDINNIPAYGILYNWESAVNSCPTGWRLPTGTEFQNLIDYYDQKETWGETTSDQSSFRIQLGGMQDYEGVFSEMDESGYYWTSIEYDSSNAEYFCYLLIDGKPIIDISRKADIEDIHGTEKSNKYSVRCIKN
jgi:uncharacterized protein (TIGR02145 family)